MSNKPPTLSERKADNEIRVYVKQTITDIQVKTRGLRQNIHSLVLDSFAREPSISDSKYPGKETVQQQQSRRHLLFSDEASRDTLGHLS